MGSIDTERFLNNTVNFDEKNPIDGTINGQGQDI